MSVNPTLFPQLVYLQVFARPMGGIPQSAKGIASPTTIAPDWLPCLAPQEMACFKLRLTQLTAIFGGKEDQGLSQEQVEVLKEIYTLSEGIHGPQINGFRVIFPLLLFDRTSFHRDLGVMIGRRTMKLSDLVNEINEGLPVLFSGLQKALRSKNRVSYAEFGSLFDTLRAMFACLTPDVLKDPAHFKLQKRAFDLLERCLSSPDELFPLLLRPMDQFEEHCRAGGVLFATSMTESKRAVLIGAANLFEHALHHCIPLSQKALASLEKILKHKAHKAHTFPIQLFKQNLTDFLGALLAKVQDLHLPIVTRQLVALEARAQRADLDAIRELHATQSKLIGATEELKGFYDSAALSDDFNAFRQALARAKGAAKGKEKALLNQAQLVLEELSDLFNFHIQDTIGLFNMMSIGCLEPALTDLTSTLTALESTPQRLPQTTSLFIRPIDALLQPLFTTLFTLITEVQDDKCAMQITEALGSLSALGADVIRGMKYLVSSGVNGFTDGIATNIGRLSKGLVRELTPLGVNPGMIGELAKLGSLQETHGVTSGIPHLYPFLNSAIGEKDELDSAALLLLIEGIFVNKHILIHLHTYIRQKLPTQSDPSVRELAKEMRQFVEALSALLDGPIVTEAEARALSLRIYQRVQENFPTPTTAFLEQHLDDPPEFIENVLASLQFVTTVNLRPFLEIGRHVSLTAGDRPKPKTRRPRKSSPPPAPTPPEPATAHPAAGKEEAAAEATLLPGEAAIKVKAAAQKLPRRIGRDQSQEAVYRNRDLEANALHLETHLTHMVALLQMEAPQSFRAFSDTLERESALALESALKYLMAHRGVQDLEDKSRFQHQLDVMATMVPGLDLTPDDLDFLRGLSVMLSNGSRPDQHRDNPRISALLRAPNPGDASRDAAKALTLIQKGFGKEPLPKIQSVELETGPDDPIKEVPEITRCRDAHGRLEEWHDQAVHHVQIMSPLHHSMLRERHIGHMVQDLPYHLRIIEPLMSKLTEGSLSPSMMNGLLHHLGHLIEKSLKLSSFYRAIPSESNSSMHIAFDLVNDRPRLYDHKLMNNLDLLPDAELAKEEVEAIRDLSDHANFTRYPAQQNGPFPDLLTRAALLTEIGEGFFDERLSAKAQKLFGPGEQHEWAAEASKALQTLQTEELLQRVQPLLTAAEKLLIHAHALRQ